MNKKNIIIGMAIFILIVLLWFLLGKISNNQQINEIDKPITNTPEVTPFEKAQELKKDYLFYGDVIKRLERLYPSREELLSEQQVKQLFPELWMGESIACHATESASFMRDIESLELDESQDSKKVVGKMQPGADKLSIRINFDGTLDFITAISVESGVVGGEPMEILVNNEYTLVASGLESDKFLDTLTVSKETGMGVWQSVNAAGLPMTYEVPDSQMIYLQCITP